MTSTDSSLSPQILQRASLLRRRVLEGPSRRCWGNAWTENVTNEVPLLGVRHPDIVRHLVDGAVEIAVLDHANNRRPLLGLPIFEALVDSVVKSRLLAARRALAEGHAGKRAERLSGIDLRVAASLVPVDSGLNRL